MSGVFPRSKTLPFLINNPISMKNHLALLSGVFLPIVCMAGEAGKPAATPNIIFIFSDDHAPAAISAYGDGRNLLQTPNLDRLAKEGIRFDRCLVPNPICGPSRATVLTGKYSHRNGFYSNEIVPFDGTQQTFPKLLQKNGYKTVLIGKWHLGSDPTGFDHWEILPNQGQYYNPPMIRNGEKVKHEGYVTDIITDLSLEWLRQRDKSKPFLLMIQHKAPHMNFEPALKNLDFDKGRKYPEPATLFDDYGGGRGLAWRDNNMKIGEILNDDHLKLKPRPDLTQEQRKLWDAYYGPRNEAFHGANLTGQDLVRWKYQRYMHDYLGAVLSVDESVGKVLKYLDDSGLAENTIVIYSSDQGFFLGEHGWFDKRWILEESMRTPLLARWPAVIKPGATSGRIVSVVDFAKTFLDAVGVPQPADMQGRSLLPLLRGEAPSDWRESFYFHYYEYPRWHRVRPHYGVVTDRYKLVHYYMPDVDDWELYDLKENPDETQNFINDPKYSDTIGKLKTELARLRAEFKVPPVSEEPRAAYGKAPFDDPASMPLRQAGGKDKSESK
jgi:arylsulfatase A-like enzyme